MSRPVQLRVSYFNDARFLIRLMQAIEKDTSMKRDRRDRVLSWLQAAQQELIDESNLRQKRNGL